MKDETERVKKRLVNQVGGQAVIEGVMMRSPERVATAVRRPDGAIVVKKQPYRSLTRRSWVFALPILRGGVALVESLWLGISALSFSGEVASKTPEDSSGPATEDGPSSFGARLRLGLTLTFSLALGIGIFFYLPLLITEWLGARSGWAFNVVDGIIRLVFFLTYLGLISLWKEIHRVFQYHGAEHKSIFAYELARDLSVGQASRCSRFHPRCGTSFLLIVMLVSVIVFMFLGRPDTVGERLLRLAFVPVIGGISFELIKVSDQGYRNRFFRIFILPGLWLQKITTKEPDASQVEVALVALHSALGLDMEEDLARQVVEHDVTPQPAPA